MKKIMKAYIPFLIYSLFVLLFYFFYAYYFPKYCVVLPYLSLFIFALYILIGTFVFGYILGKVVQKRLSNPQIGICIILAVISFLIMGVLGGLGNVLRELSGGFEINFSKFLMGLHHYETKINAIGTLVCFFIGELVEYRKQIRSENNEEKSINSRK